MAGYKFSLSRLLIAFTACCMIVGLVRGVEFRTPYYEAVGGLWVDFDHGQLHGINTIGVRITHRGEWSPQFDRYRGPCIGCSPGISWGSSQNPGHPRIYWFSVARPSPNYVHSF